MFCHDGAVIGVHPAVPKLDAHVIAQPLGSKYSQAGVFMQLARPAMYDPAIEGHTVPRLHIPATTPKLFALQS